MIVGANQGANSQVYWDDRFDTNWEEDRGRAYSRNYAELAFSHVPQWLIGDIKRNALSICDWGCAMGDGTAHLADLLPTAKVTGIDFSAPGIVKAREYYPHVSFECQNWLVDDLQSNAVYDVVFSSHTFEHFNDPWAVMKTLAPRVGRALVFMVPFQEDDLSAEHLYSFQFGNILLKPCDNFELAYCEVIDGEVERKNCWRGRQVLLVYIRRDDSLWNGLTLADTRLTTSASDEMANALKDVVEEQEVSLKNKDAQLLERESKLRDKMLQREHQLREKLKVTLRAEKRKHAATKNQLRCAEDWSSTLQSSVRFRIGSAIVGAGSWLIRLLKAPLILFACVRGENRVDAHVPSTRNQRRYNDLVTTIGHLTRGGRSKKSSAPSGGDSRADCSPEKSFVYDLSTIDAQAVRERDIGYLFPPIASPERTAPETTVASVLDEFSDQCFRHEANLVRVTPDNWFDRFEEKPPRCLLVESAWHGNRDSWRKMIEFCDNVVDNELVHLVDYCKSKQIPTVFWNKEDPPNFEHFIDAAGHFDYVFTSDRESIPRYREILGHDRIEALPFAAQPQIHNPIGKRDSPLLEVGFAGSWYANKHEDRRELLRFLLDAASDRNLHVFDRMSEFTTSDHHLYPKRFSPFLHAALPYDQMVRAYRDFRLFLNVNSVLESSTMFARRVFEVLACQTNVVSTTSLGVEQMLGDVVDIVHCESEARDAISNLLQNERVRGHKAHLGWRKVMREHTYGARLQTIAESIGLDGVSGESRPLVSVVVLHREPGNLDGLLDALHAQTYPNLEVLIVGAAGVKLDPRLAAMLSNEPRLRLVRSPTDDLAGILAYCSRAATGELLTLFDSRDAYGADFVWDLVSAFSFSNTDSVGKAGYYTALSSGGRAGMVGPGERFQLVRQIPVRSFLVAVSLLRCEGTWHLDRGYFLRKATETDGPWPWSYSSDAFNYLRNGNCHQVSGAGPVEVTIARSDIFI